MLLAASALMVGPAGGEGTYRSPLRGRADLPGAVIFDGSDVPEPRAVARIIVFSWDVNQAELWERIEYFGAPNVFPQASVQADGTFVLRDLVPGTIYAVKAGRIPRGWRLRSALLGPDDVLDTQLTLTGAGLPNAETRLKLTFTDRHNLVIGKVIGPRESDDASPVSTTVVAIPIDPRYWAVPSRRIRTFRTHIGGTFRFEDLPAGEYALVATPDGAFTADSARNPDDLARLIGGATAAHVAISEQGTTTQDLRVGQRLALSSPDGREQLHHAASDASLPQPSSAGTPRQAHPRARGRADGGVEGVVRRD